MLGKQYRSLSSSLCSFLHSPVISSHLGPIILLSTLFSNTRILRSSLNVSDQVLHTYKTTGKIIVLYFLIFAYLSTDNKMENYSTKLQVCRREVGRAKQNCSPLPDLTTLTAPRVLCLEMYFSTRQLYLW